MNGRLWILSALLLLCGFCAGLLWPVSGWGMAGQSHRVRQERAPVAAGSPAHAGTIGSPATAMAREGETAERDPQAVMAYVPAHAGTIGSPATAMAREGETAESDPQAVMAYVPAHAGTIGSPAVAMAREGETAESDPQAVMAYADGRAEPTATAEPSPASAPDNLFAIAVVPSATAAGTADTAVPSEANEVHAATPGRATATGAGIFGGATEADAAAPGGATEPNTGLFSEATEADEAAPSGATPGGATEAAPTIPGGFAIQVLRGEEAAPKKRVLIYHTHTYEAYEKTPEMNYRETEEWRTADHRFNVVRVGEELAGLLRGLGVEVIHDATAFEPPELSSAYARSLEMLENRQAAGESYDLYIDLHRDAFVPSQAQSNAVSAGGNRLARLMLLVGRGDGQTSADYSQKPDWESNLSLAQRITDSLNRQRDGLCKSVMVKSGRYNQHAAPCCVLIEAGNNRNTLAEALAAMPYLADAILEALEE